MIVKKILYVDIPKGVSKFAGHDTWSDLEKAVQREIDAEFKSGKGAIIDRISRKVIKDTVDPVVKAALESNFKIGLGLSPEEALVGDLTKVIKQAIKGTVEKADTIEKVTSLDKELEEFISSDIPDEKTATSIDKVSDFFY
jgi:hypothetical protein